MSFAQLQAGSILASRKHLSVSLMARKSKLNVDLFDIGKSGVQSYRQALAVTGQNIANINTEGYKRRDVSLEEAATGHGINSVGNTVLEFVSAKSAAPLMNSC